MATTRITNQEQESKRRRLLLIDARKDGTCLKKSLAQLDLETWQRLFLFGFFYSPTWFWLGSWKTLRSASERMPGWRKRTIRWRIYLHSLKARHKLQHLIPPSSKPRVFIFLAADYGNLGDLAITEAQKRFLEAELPGYEILEVPISQTLAGIRTLKKRVNPDDLITLIGGGNTGDLYDDIQYLREMVIVAFPSIRIISFPQTIEFSDTTYGRWAQKRAQRVFSQHKRLTLMARDSNSASLAATLFDSTPVLAAPDIVLSLAHQTEPTKGRHGFLVALRDDLERNPLAPTRQSIHDELATLGPVKMLDTHIGEVRLSESERKEELIKIWSSFAESEVVVTDRLHGMIFSMITGTPCVVLDSRTGKVFQFLHDWLPNPKDPPTTVEHERFPIVEWHPNIGLGVRECVDSMRSKSFLYRPNWAVRQIEDVFIKGLES